MPFLSKEIWRNLNYSFDISYFLIVQAFLQYVCSLISLSKKITQLSYETILSEIERRSYKICHSRNQQSVALISLMGDCMKI